MVLLYKNTTSTESGLITQKKENSWNHVIKTNSSKNILFLLDKVNEEDFYYNEKDDTLCRISGQDTVHHNNYGWNFLNGYETENYDKRFPQYREAYKIGEAKGIFKKQQYNADLDEKPKQAPRYAQNPLVPLGSYIPCCPRKTDFDRWVDFPEYHTAYKLAIEKGLLKEQPVKEQPVSTDVTFAQMQKAKSLLESTSLDADMLALLIAKTKTIAEEVGGMDKLLDVVKCLAILKS